jgi:hypothetical protein
MVSLSRDFIIIEYMFYFVKCGFSAAETHACLRTVHAESTEFSIIFSVNSVPLWLKIHCIGAGCSTLIKALFTRFDLPADGIKTAPADRSRLFVGGP